MLSSILRDHTLVTNNERVVACLYLALKRGDEKILICDRSQDEELPSPLLKIVGKPFAFKTESDTDGRIWYLISTNMGEPKEKVFRFTDQGTIEVRTNNLWQEGLGGWKVYLPNNWL